MKILLFLVIGVVVLAAGAMVFLAMQSRNGAAPGLVDGVLAPCPASPNCVTSEAGAPASHLVAPLPAAAWDRLPAVIAAQGGKVVMQRDDYIAAEFSTPLMKFVDDVEFRNAGDAVHVRSASRVGHSDMGANKKRMDALRAALTD
ncbi:MAG: DUF1499 domain-containing protein [Hyphococcus sp.]